MTPAPFEPWQRLYEYSATAEQRGLRVIIAGAGGAAHLPGFASPLPPAAPHSSPAPPRVSSLIGTSWCSRRVAPRRNAPLPPYAGWLRQSRHYPLSASPSSPPLSRATIRFCPSCRSLRRVPNLAGCRRSACLVQTVSCPLGCGECTIYSGRATFPDAEGCSGCYRRHRERCKCWYAFRASCE